MIQITEEDLADLIAEGIDLALQELTGKGKLEGIEQSHTKRARLHSKIYKAYDDEGESDDDEAIHHGMSADQHANNARRANALKRIRDAAATMKKAKSDNETAKRERM